MDNCKQTARAKCSRRHRHPTIEALIVCVSMLVSSLGAFAQSDTNGVEEQNFPARATGQWPAVLEQFLDGTESFSARFEQEIWTDDQQLVETAGGSMALLRPNRFRWQYETPYEQLIVADGKSLWMYDVEIEQVTRSDIDDADIASPAMLLGGDGAVHESFTVLDTDEDEGVFWVSLAPTQGGAAFSLVRMGFSGANLTALEFVDGLNQTTVIQFLDVQTNVTLARELFEFKIPRGVHVLGGRG